MDETGAKEDLLLALKQNERLENELNQLNNLNDSFDENTTPLCGEVIELKECLMSQTDCQTSKDIGLQYAYRVLSYKLL